MINSSEFTEAMIGLIIMDISGREYCLNIRDIYTILNPCDLEEQDIYSSTFPHIKTDDKNIPILGLNKYLGAVSPKPTETTRIVVVDANNRQLAFFADRVKEVFTISRSLKEKLEFIPYVGSLYLAGQIRFKERELYLPDLQRIAEDFCAVEN